MAMLVSDLAEEFDVDKSSLRKWILKHFGADSLEKVRVIGVASHMNAVRTDLASEVKRKLIEWKGSIRKHTTSVIVEVERRPPRKLRVWWVPQVPMKAFYVPIDSIGEGQKILEVLADYDLFQFENKIKGDYSNGGGIQVFDDMDDTDTPEGSWTDWEDE